MSSNEIPANAHDLSPPTFPVVTVLTTALILGFFSGLIAMVHYYASGLDTAPTVVSGEQKLAEHKASQDEQIRSYKPYDPATKTVGIPVELAVAKMVEEGNRTGHLPFPMKPFPKPEPAKSEALPPPKADAKTPDKK